MTKAGSLRKPISVFAGLLSRAARDRRGGIAVTFSLSLIPLLGCLALAVDVSTWYAARAKLQSIADGAAIASTRELRVGRPSEAQILDAARRYADSSLQYGVAYIRAIEVTASLSRERNQVRVEMTSEVSPIFSRFITNAFYSVSVESTARLSGTIPICMIGTDENASGTVTFEDSARLSAEQCGVYSNSRHRNGLRLEDSSEVTAAQICSVGGFRRDKGAKAVPAPQDGCPRIGDPLAPRASEIANPCGHLAATTPFRINGSMNLMQNEFCGGVIIESGADVSFSAGIYHIGGAGLIVQDDARISGEGVGFHFVGDAAFDFAAGSTITLSAPVTGAMAGILFLENPNSKQGNRFRISSNNARKLLGTIYLPNGELVIDAKEPVAGDSAYTVIVARRIKLERSPRLVLNTDYAATDVPVPEGVGPNSPVRLSQ